MGSKRNAKRPNRPPEGQPWVWFTAELIASAAWRAMSINAHRALYRILLEHMAHAGTENGNLIVTHRDFIDAGVTPNFVADAIAELEHLKLIIVKWGRGGAGTGTANKFQLAWLPERESRICDDQWKRTTIEDVERWTAIKRKADGKRRARKMPKSAKQGFTKTKLHSRNSEWATNGSVSENGENGNRILDLRPIPTNGSVSTSNISKGYQGQSPPTAQAKGTPTAQAALAEMIGDGEAGWLVLQRLPDDFRESLEAKEMAGTISAADIAEARLQAAHSNQSPSEQ